MEERKKSNYNYVKEYRAKTNEPATAHKTKRNWEMYRFYKTLTSEELQTLIRKRKEEKKYAIKYERWSELEEIKDDIAMLSRAYENKKKGELEKEGFTRIYDEE